MTPRSEPIAGRGARFDVIGALLLVATTLGVYGFLLTVEGVVGRGGLRGPFPFAIGIAAVLIGLAAHAMIAAGRGYLSGLWPGLIFPVAFSVFHFATLGELDRGWYSERLAPFAWLLSASCLLAWMCGHALARGRRPFVPVRGAVLGGRALNRVELRRIAWLGALTFAAGLSLELWILVRLGLTNLLVINYVAWKSAFIESGVQMAATGALALLICLVGLHISCTASAIATGRLFIHPLVLAGFVVYVSVLVLSGDRSELTTALIGILIIRHFLIRPFPFGQVAVMAVVAIMLFGGIKYYRATKDVDVLLDSATDPEVILYKNANETGFTQDTVVRSVELVPDRFDHFMGMTYAAAVTRVVPKVLNPGGLDFVSSTWIVEQTTDKKDSDPKGGIGFSPVAEAYINFGAALAPLVLLLMGALHGRIERWLSGPRVDPRLFALFLAINGALFLHTRNTAVMYVRGSIWSALIIFGVFAVFTALLRERTAATQPPPSSSAGSGP